MSSVDIDKIRGVFVAIDCDTCEGTGKVCLNDSSRFPTECPACEGTKLTRAAISLEDFKHLTNAYPLIGKYKTLPSGGR